MKSWVVAECYISTPLTISAMVEGSAARANFPELGNCPYIKFKSYYIVYIGRVVPLRGDTGYSNVQVSTHTSPLIYNHGNVRINYDEVNELGIVNENGERSDHFRCGVNFPGAQRLPHKVWKRSKCIFLESRIRCAKSNHFADSGEIRLPSVLKGNLFMRMRMVWLSDSDWLLRFFQNIT